MSSRGHRKARTPDINQIGQRMGGGGGTIRSCLRPGCDNVDFNFGQQIYIHDH